MSPPPAVKGGSVQQGLSAAYELLAFCLHRLAADKRYSLNGYQKMQPDRYPTVGTFRNDTETEMRLYLEMIPNEVVLSPGHSVELLARPSPDLLPLTIGLVDDGLQIHGNKEFDPDWHVRFNGKLIRAGHPTILSDYESAHALTLRA